MKRLFSVFISLLFAFQAHGAVVLEKIDGAIWDQVDRIRVANDQMVKLGDKRYRLETGNENVLVNPNFQASQVAQGWTYNPANFDLVKLDDTYAYTGTHSLQLDLKHGNFTDLELISQTYAAGYKLGGSDLEASIRIAKAVLDPAVTLKWCASVDSVIVNCVTIPSLPANTSFQKYAVAFASKPAFATTYKVGLYATYNVTSGAVGVLALADASLKPTQGVYSSDTLTYLGTAAGTISPDTGTITAGNYTIAAKNWRAADRLRHEVNITFTGTPGTWTVLNYTLPAGFVIDSSKMTSTTPAVAEVGNGSLIGSPNILKIYYLNTTRVRPRSFFVSGGAVVGGDISSTNVSSGTVITFTVDLPIQGWNDTNIVTPSSGANLLGTHFFTREPTCPVNSVSDNATITRAQYPALFAKWQIAAGTDTLALAEAGLYTRSTGTQTFGGVTYTATLGQKRNDAMQGWQLGISQVAGGAPIYYGSSRANENVIGGTSGAGHGLLQMKTDQQGVASKATAYSDGTNGTPRIDSQTHGADIAKTGCYWAVANPFLPISGMVVSSDASAAGQSTVINTVKTITGNYTLTGDDETLNINAAGASGNITVTLPSAALYPGKKYNLRITSGNYHATIDGFGAEGICGQPTIKVAGANDGITIQSATTGWIGLDGACQRTIAVNYSGGGTAGVCNSSPCTINNSYGGLLSVLRPSTGVFQPNYAGLFSSAPTCSIQGGNNAAFVLGFINSTLPTITSADLRTASNGGTYLDTFGMITCTGPR